MNCCPGGLRRAISWLWTVASRWFGLEQEGFGIVFVEAAACALAQVAGRSGGSDEAVLNGVTGVVVANSRSERDLANAIGELVLDDERRHAYARGPASWRSRIFRGTHSRRSFRHDSRPLTTSAPRARCSKVEMMEVR